MKDGDQCSRVFFRGIRRRLIVDIRYLRPWARHCITDEEASHLLLPVSPNDVKQAVFDIVEDKAPGPDGYSSGFFKAAWPVVGKEVTRVVLDFFSTGKTTETDQLHNFGSNTKAFIPGRSIGDNIMLAQELFSGYNQIHLPPRCALKVDIRNAYDTVEWDFLLADLQLFGFPPKFTRWIDERITTGRSHYRLINLSSLWKLYIWDFYNELSRTCNSTYHLKCESSKSLQGGIGPGLRRVSGLRLNIQKSHLIISRSAQELKDQMLEILGFQEGASTDEGFPLSYAGRVQIIKSVLSALSLYWASAFILPKKVINEIEKRLRNFLWKGTTSSGYAKVALKDVCRPADEGGLGFTDISTLNLALMSKKLCDIIRCDRTSIWVQWLYQGRLRDTSIWTVREHGGSWGWRKMLRLRPFLRSIVDYQIGNGDRFLIWQDPWHHLGPLIEWFPRGPCHLRLEESAKLSSVISAGEWQWPTITDFECLEITHNLPLILGGEDRVVWRCDEGKPTTQALYRLFDPPEPKVRWSSLLLGSLKIPHHSFILWLAILGKLPTRDKSWLSHLGVWHIVR
ncbi:UNVERIFIED_CONTAM: hypothetical protein Sindi_1664900 [Sesamum indicum]